MATAGSDELVEVAPRGDSLRHGGTELAEWATQMQLSANQSSTEKSSGKAGEPALRSQPALSAFGDDVLGEAPTVPYKDSPQAISMYDSSSWNAVTQDLASTGKLISADTAAASSFLLTPAVAPSAEMAVGEVPLGSSSKGPLLGGLNGELGDVPVITLRYNDIYPSPKSPESPNTQADWQSHHTYSSPASSSAFPWPARTHSSTARNLSYLPETVVAFPTHDSISRSTPPVSPAGPTTIVSVALDKGRNGSKESVSVTEGPYAGTGAQKQTPPDITTRVESAPMQRDFVATVPQIYYPPGHNRKVSENAPSLKNSGAAHTSTDWRFSMRRAKSKVRRALLFPGGTAAGAKRRVKAGRTASQNQRAVSLGTLPSELDQHAQPLAPFPNLVHDPARRMWTVRAQQENGAPLLVGKEDHLFGQSLSRELGLEEEVVGTSELGNVRSSGKENVVPQSQPEQSSQVGDVTTPMARFSDRPHYDMYSDPILEEPEDEPIQPRVLSMADANSENPLAQHQQHGSGSAPPTIHPLTINASKSTIERTSPRSPVDTRTKHPSYAVPERRESLFDEQAAADLAVAFAEADTSGARMPTSSVPMNAAVAAMERSGSVAPGHGLHRRISLQIKVTPGGINPKVDVKLMKERRQSSDGSATSRWRSRENLVSAVANSPPSANPDPTSRPSSDSRKQSGSGSFSSLDRTGTVASFLDPGSLRKQTWAPRTPLRVVNASEADSDSDEDRPLTVLTVKRSTGDTNSSTGPLAINSSARAMSTVSGEPLVESPVKESVLTASMDQRDGLIDCSPQAGSFGNRLPPTLSARNDSLTTDTTAVSALLEDSADGGSLSTAVDDGLVVNEAPFGSGEAISAVGSSSVFPPGLITDESPAPQTSPASPTTDSLPTVLRTEKDWAAAQADLLNRISQQLSRISVSTPPDPATRFSHSTSATSSHQKTPWPCNETTSTTRMSGQMNASDSFSASSTSQFMSMEEDLSHFSTNVKFPIRTNSIPVNGKEMSMLTSQTTVSYPTVIVPAHRHTSQTASTHEHIPSLPAAVDEGISRQGSASTAPYGAPWNARQSQDYTEEHLLRQPSHSVPGMMGGPLSTTLTSYGTHRQQEHPYPTSQPLFSPPFVTPPSHPSLTNQHYPTPVSPPFSSAAPPPSSHPILDPAATDSSPMTNSNLIHDFEFIPSDLSSHRHRSSSPWSFVSGASAHLTRAPSGSNTAHAARAGFAPRQNPSSTSIPAASMVVPTALPLSPGSQYLRPEQPSRPPHPSELYSRPDYRSGLSPGSQGYYDAYSSESGTLQPGSSSAPMTSNNDRRWTVSHGAGTPAQSHPSQYPSAFSPNPSPHRSDSQPYPAIDAHGLPRNQTVIPPRPSLLPNTPSASLLPKAPMHNRSPPRPNLRAAHSSPNLDSTSSHHHSSSSSRQQQPQSPPKPGRWSRVVELVRGR